MTAKASALGCLACLTTLYEAVALMRIGDFVAAAILIISTGLLAFYVRAILLKVLANERSKPPAAA